MKECETCRFNEHNTKTGVNLCPNSCYEFEYWQPIDKPKYKLTEKYKDGLCLLDFKKVAVESGCRGAEKKVGVLRDRTHERFNMYDDEKKAISFWLDFMIVKNNINWLIEKGFIEEDNQLLPCPICGEEVKIYKPGEWCKGFYNENRTSLIGCNAASYNRGCGLSFSLISKRESHKRIKMWNNQNRKD